MGKQIVLINLFGEESINQVQAAGTNLPSAGAIADGTILSNISGGSAAAVANTLQAVSDKSPSKTGVTALTAIATANATDLASAIALANATKAAYNALLAALKVQS